MTERSQRRNLLISLCLAAATVAVYAPVRHFQFTSYDDGDYVYENPQVQSGLTLRGLVWAFTTSHASNWHPLTWLSHMLDCQLFGLNAGPHHLVNVLFHVASVLLLFHVLNRMTAAPWRSAFVAALFALHPLHVESVAWVAERKDVLSAFFWMLTMWAYVRYVETFNTQRFQPERFWGKLANVFYGLALLFFALGLMAKPMLVTLPFVLLLLDYWPLDRTQWTASVSSAKAKVPLGRLLKEKLPFLALTVVSCAVTFRVQRMGGIVVSLEHLPIGERVANAAVSPLRYLSKAFWPTGLAVFYPYVKWPSDAVVAAVAVLVVVSAWVIWEARREPQFLVGWLWYLGTLVPVIGLVQVGLHSMADRFTYLPSIGLFIMAAWIVPCGATGQRVRKLATAATAAALLGVFAVLCRFQIRCWRSSETLFRHALEVTTNNWLAHNNLGYILARTGRLDSAIEQYNEALRIKPDCDEAHYNMGNALTRQGKGSEAVAEYREALRINPDNVKAHNNLGAALARQGKLSEAMAEYAAALRIRPDYAEAHFNLGLALAGQGKLAEATAEYTAALRSKPDYVEAHNNLGIALRRMDRIQEAIEHYEQALRLRPDFVDAHNNLGNALLQRGNLTEAVQHFEQAARLEPDFAVAQNKLAWVLATLGPADGGDPVRAVTLAQRACELTGNRVAACLDTLAVAYAAAGRFSEAIATAQKAIELARSAGQPELVREIEARLLLYRDGRPYRQSAEGTGIHNP
jgi:tetratricopeptide (TPR) repeat protein